MTIEAVNKFIGRAVISDYFRNKFISGQMIREEIASVDPGLDEQDIIAIATAKMFTNSFAVFAAGIDKYLNRRYPRSQPAGDNLPISV